jgi:hypothetical protein
VGLYAAHSLVWQMVLDSALMFYYAYAVQHFGALPYRDIVDHQPPGSLLIYAVVGRVLGYSDLAFRAADLTWLLCIGLVGFLLLAPLNRTMACCGALLFAAQYLGAGQEMAFERDAVLAVPIALAALIISRYGTSHRTRAFVLAGILTGLAATIKPPAAIGLVVLVLFSGTAENFRGTLTSALAVAAGALIPLGLTALWLVKNGIWTDWLELYQNLVPLYLRLNPWHIGVDSRTWFAQCFSVALRFGDLTPWLLPATLGVYWILWESPPDPVRQRTVKLLAGLALGFAIYAVSGLKMWPYYWMPCRYFLTLCAVLVLEPVLSGKLPAHRSRFFVLTLMMGWFFTFAIPESMWRLFRGLPAQPEVNARVDTIARWLKAHTRPGEAVQPFDWVNGGTHALLLAGLRVPTRIYVDYALYLGPSSPYCEKLRRQFLGDLARNPPRYMLEMRVRGSPRGLDCLPKIPGLDHFIQTRYRIACDGGADFVIYERRFPVTRPLHGPGWNSNL